MQYAYTLDGIADLLGFCIMYANVTGHSYTLPLYATVHGFGMVAQRELVLGEGGSTMRLETRILFRPVVGIRTEEQLCDLSYIYQQGQPKCPSLEEVWVKASGK